MWAKTPTANLVRYVPSGKYFARLRVAGKLIRKWLKTDRLGVASSRGRVTELFNRSATHFKFFVGFVSFCLFLFSRFVSFAEEGFDDSFGSTQGQLSFFSDGE